MRIQTVSRIVCQVVLALFAGVRVERGENVGGLVDRHSAIALAECEIRVSVDDVDGTGIAGRAGDWLSQVEQLAESDGVLGRLRHVEVSRWESLGPEEGELVAYGVCGYNVPVVQAFEAFRRGVSRDGEVEAGEEGWLASAGGGEAGQDCGIQEFGRLGGDSLGDDRAKGVSNADDMLEGRAGNLALAQDVDQLFGDGDLQRSLDYLDWVRMV